MLAGGLGGSEALVRFEPLTMIVDQRDQSDGGLKSHLGKRGYTVQRCVHRRIEHTIGAQDV